MRATLAHTDLATLFAELDTLAARHQEALDHAAARERLEFLQQRLDQLLASLRQLRAADAVLQRLGDNKNIYHRTCKQLRQAIPSTMRAPSLALASANLDLLLLVEYTCVSIACAEERLEQAIAQIVDGLKLNNNAAPNTEGRVRAVIEQMVSSCEPADLADLMGRE